jgi:hypothetical protein
MDADPAVSRCAEFQRGPLSESGEGIDLEGGAITVGAVLADEALEFEVENDPGVGSCAPSRGISCCGCVPADDGWEDDDDEGGGEGSRASGCLAALFSCACSSLRRRLGVRFGAPDNEVEGLLGLSVGRDVWWGWASRSRDRLVDRL